ncbi:hypothetical protein [Sulfuricurvum sp.]|uniref:hypothetical protein n=1 Tax=Sulfuricurvum sp. TaxID=2025608 RepID=UPI002639B2A6|nr:hypothetical protein [Sulfuricurvum sp.]MDD3597419.1 hypothetical protein [Sulfuricurvum sp.]
MNITGDSLLELLLIPMTDTKMVETIDALGWEQPVMDERYLEELSIDIGGSKQGGILFDFKEPNGHTPDGEPCLVQIDFYHDQKVKAPFGLLFSDNYQQCCEKIGHKADYNSELDDDMKIWIIDKKYILTINFKNSELSNIRSFIINIFDENNIDDDMYKNEE